MSNININVEGRDGRLSGYIAGKNTDLLATLVLLAGDLILRHTKPEDHEKTVASVSEALFCTVKILAKHVNISVWDMVEDD